MIFWSLLLKKSSKEKCWQISKNNQIISACRIEVFAQKITMNEKSTTRGLMLKNKNVSKRAIEIYLFWKEMLFKSWQNPWKILIKEFMFYQIVANIFTKNELLYRLLGFFQGFCLDLSNGLWHVLWFLFLLIFRFELHLIFRFELFSDLYMKYLQVKTTMTYKG